MAVLLTDPKLVLPFYSGVFMDRTAGFIKLYFPVFLLGAIFGKLMEVSGFCAIDHPFGLGCDRALARDVSIVLVCAILTYGGVSLFVVAFAVYPFAAEMFRAAGIPKRLIPATIALGAFTFTMDALPGSPQIQNIIPTTFFKTDAWAAPWLGIAGSIFLLARGLSYLEWRRRSALRNGEGYGENHMNEPAPPEGEVLPHPLLAVFPLMLVGVLNKLFTLWIPAIYGYAIRVLLVWHKDCRADRCAGRCSALGSASGSFHGNSSDRCERLDADSALRFSRLQEQRWVELCLRL